MSSGSVKDSLLVTMADVSMDEILSLFVMLQINEIGVGKGCQVVMLLWVRERWVRHLNALENSDDAVPLHEEPFPVEDGLEKLKFRGRVPVGR